MEPRPTSQSSTSTPSTADACPHCGKPYPRFEIAPLHPGGRSFWVSGQCECDGAVAERTREERTERQRCLRRAWEQTGVPKDYRDVLPDGDGLSRLDLENGEGLYLHGPRGTGKTTDACRLLKAYVMRNTDAQGYCSARFVSTSRWLSSMQDTFGMRGVSGDELFYRVANTTFLVLDDIGKISATNPDWAVRKLFDLVDERCSNHRPTVITSKFSLPELVGRLTVNGDDDIGGDIVSRIRKMCQPKRYDGRDMRIHGGTDGSERGQGQEGLPLWPYDQRR